MRRDLVSHGYGAVTRRTVHVHLDYANRPVNELDPVERRVAAALGLPLTYHGKDRGQSAMRYFVDNTLPKTTIAKAQITNAIVARALTSRITADIPVSEIKTHQDWIRPTQVLIALTGVSSGTPPNVVRVDGDFVLLDGNHRVTAALMRGDPTITVSLDKGDV